MNSFGPHVKIFGFCYHMNMLKEKKKRNKYITNKKFMKTQIFLQSKHQLRHNITRGGNFWYSRNCVGPLNDENKLQVVEKNKNLKNLWKFIIS